MGVERLEGRELLAYTPLGYSLPDLTVSGYTSNVASWGGPLTATVDVQNLGAETLIEPAYPVTSTTYAQTSLLPGGPSTADAIPPPTVGVYLSARPHSKLVQVATLSFPSNITDFKQNNLIQLTGTFNLPPQPAGFPGDGGKVFVTFKVAYPGNETDLTNNTAKGHPIQIQSPFPELVVTDLSVPPVMQPGDTIQPNIMITNYGPASTSAQGPVEVRLVASVNRRFNSGSSKIASYLIPNIPGISSISSGTTDLTAENLSPQGAPTTIAITDGTNNAGTATVQGNTVTINGLAKTLPTSPKSYYIGVVVDPGNSLKQIQVIGRVGPKNQLGRPMKVGPNRSGLPPAGVVYAGNGTTNLPFPYPANVPVFTPATTPQTGIKTS